MSRIFLLLALTFGIAETADAQVWRRATNLALSEARANAVRAMLVGLGVDAGRLEAAGLGQTRPVAGNVTAEGRAQNRRVELVRL